MDGPIILPRGYLLSLIWVLDQDIVLTDLTTRQGRPLINNTSTLLEFTKYPRDDTYKIRTTVTRVTMLVVLIATPCCLP